jgi:hypothetical protein
MDEQQPWQDSDFDAAAFLEEFLSSLAIPDHQDHQQTETMRRRRNED